MARQRLAAFWCFLICGHGLVASLNLDVEPTQLAPGLTRSLTVNCTFDFESSLDFSGLMSLIVSKNDGQNDNTETFQDLVSLNVFTQDQVNLLSHLTATVSGHISMRNDSFIALHWMYPAQQESGLYRCSANGIDKTGRPQSVSKTTLVTAKTPDLDMLITSVRLLQSESDQNKEKLEQEKRLRSKMMAGILFERSEDYNGRYYLLSREYFSEADTAESVCEGLGGYLAEIDDAAENGVIKNFLNKAAAEVKNVLIGATKEGPSGQWKQRFSNRPVVYFDWYRGQPDRGNSEFCIILYRPAVWKMYDHPCVLNPSTNTRHYICEVQI